MVVNRKNLRNRIFKISFSFVIFALAIVLGLSVRSNAKADTVYKTSFISDYNYMGLHSSADNISISSLNNYTYNYTYLDENRTGKWFDVTNPGPKLIGTFMYNNFVLGIGRSSFIMYVPFNSIYIDGSWYYPNTFDFYFGNAFPYSGHSNALSAHNTTSVKFEIFVFSSADYSGMFGLNSKDVVYSQTFNRIYSIAGEFDPYSSVYNSNFKIPNLVNTLAGNQNLNANFVSFSNTNMFNVDFNYDERPVTIETALGDGFRLYKNSLVSAPSGLYGVVGVLVTINSESPIFDSSYGTGAWLSQYLPYIKVYNNANVTETYQAGFNDGVDSINTQQYYDNGYNTGYNVGRNSVDINAVQTQAYSDGYNAGLLSSSHDYGIKDLLYSIFDVPINVLSNLFSFTIFGSNVWAIIVSLLTILVVIWIVSKVLGIVFSGGGKK